jgi:nicotinamidase-related amidase
MIPKFSQDTALLLIDCQRGVDELTHWGGARAQRNQPEAESRLLQVLAAWRTKKLPIAYTVHNSRERNSPLRLDREGGKQKPGFEPQGGEVVVTKSMNSAFIGTSLEIDLRRMKINRLLIGGFFTNMCISTSVRMANNLGFDTYLIHDACACVNRAGVDGRQWTAEEVHGVTIASLHGEFCTAVDHHAALGLLEKDAGHLRRVQGNE